MPLKKLPHLQALNSGKDIYGLKVLVALLNNRTLDQKVLILLQTEDLVDFQMVRTVGMLPK